MQVPVSLGVSGYEGFSLYKGWRKLGSKGEDGTNIKIHQLVIYGLFGVLAGLVGGLLGLGGGFIMGPLFLELGIPPQVSANPCQCCTYSHVSILSHGLKSARHVKIQNQTQSNTKKIQISH